MHWLRGSVAILALGAAACDRLAGEAPAPAPAPPTDQAAPIGDIGAYAGRSYADFVAAHPDRLSADALGISAADSQRLSQAMAASSGALLEGGGAEALLFRGCAASGCGDAVAVAAIDGATGAIFLGVRDAGGKDVLVTNERLEALLRLSAPTRDWLDAGVLQTPPESPAPEGQERP